MSGASDPWTHLDFQVLGPLRVVVDGVDVPIATRRQRALLVLLLMNVGRVVPVDRLIDQLWDGTPPPQGTVTLRSYVSNVRQALGGPDGAGSRLITRAQGYCLDVPAETLDAVRLSSGAQHGREHLRHHRPEQALTVFDDAVGTWRGDPLADVADHEAARSTIAQLTETYLGAVEGRFEALLALGRHADALPGLEGFTADHPLREEPRALLMVALYRAGRAADALEVHRSFRGLLHEQLGIDPSGRLDDLYRRILEQDPALAPAAPVREPGTPDGGTAVIVGRSRELAQIEARLDALARRGEGSLLLIAGEPGIGKTTLLEALQRQARRFGMKVHHGRSPAATGAPAFWPWVQVVESLAAGLDDDALRQACAGAARPVTLLSATVAERVGQAAPILGDDPQTQRFLLYDAVSVFIRQAGRQTPTVVTLDDVHWADQPSLELISYLTPGLAAQPILLVAAYRNLPNQRSDALDATLATVFREDVASEMSLAGIGPAGVADLLVALLGQVTDDSVRSRLVTALHERTGGNPFFVRQLARLLTDDKADPFEALSVPAPPGVRHVVARRLADLPDTARSLLAAAAVIGRDFDLRITAAAAELDIGTAMDAFDEAVRHGLVETTSEGSGRRFVHALVQEVVLDGLPPGRTARLHAGIAAQLERTPTTNPDELARHLWAARDLVGPAAVPALVAAADAAASVYALEQAEAHLRHALTLVHAHPGADPSTELSLLLRLFRLIVSVRGWGHADVRTVMDRAMELAEAGAYNDGTAQLWWSLFFFLLDRNDPSFVQVANTLLEAVGATDPAATDSPPVATEHVGHAARAVVQLTGIFAALDVDDRGLAYARLEAARRHVEAAPAADLAAFDEHLHVMLLLIEGYWAALTGDRDTYRSTTDAAVALADADGRPFPRAVARTLAAASGPYLPDVPFVHELAGQALDLDQRFRFGWLASLAGCMHGWAGAHLDGPDPEMVARLEAWLADIVAAGHLGNESTMLLLLADVYRLAGRRDAARDALLRARANPGPYRGLVVDMLDDRLQRLEDA